MPRPGILPGQNRRTCGSGDTPRPGILPGQNRRTCGSGDMPRLGRSPRVKIESTAARAGASRPDRADFRGHDGIGRHARFRFSWSDPSGFESPCPQTEKPDAGQTPMGCGPASGFVLDWSVCISALIRRGLRRATFPRRGKAFFHRAPGRKGAPCAPAMAGCGRQAHAVRPYRLAEFRISGVRRKGCRRIGPHPPRLTPRHLPPEGEAFLPPGAGP